MARRFKRFIFLPGRTVTVRDQPTYPITTDIVMAGFGDSMTDQQSDATPNHFENMGYIPALQMTTGNRYIWDNSLNFGVSGEKTGTMLTRAITVRDACIAAGVTEILFLGGANDRRQKETASYTISNITAIAAIFTAVGINFNILTTFYATDNFYKTKNSTFFTDAEVAQCKADVLTVNTALRAMASAKVRIIEVFDIMVDNMGNAVAAHLQSDELHENATASWKIMERIYDLLFSIYGVRNFTLSPNNKLANTNFAGTTGTISASRETGVLATGHTTAGSAPAGTPASRSLFKTLKGQGVAFAFPAAGSTRDNTRIINRYTSSADVGKTAYYELEFKIGDVGTGTGVWHALSAEMVTNIGSDLAIGYDRGASTDKVPVDLMKAFCDARQRSLLIRTPKAAVPAGATYVEGRLNLECDTTGGARSGAVELLNEQLVIA